MCFYGVSNVSPAIYKYPTILYSYGYVGLNQKFSANASLSG